MCCPGKIFNLIASSYEGPTSTRLCIGPLSPWNRIYVAHPQVHHVFFYTTSTVFSVMLLVIEPRTTCVCLENTTNWASCLVAFLVISKKRHGKRQWKSWIALKKWTNNPPPKKTKNNKHKHSSVATSWRTYHQDLVISDSLKKKKLICSVCRLSLYFAFLEELLEYISVLTTDKYS